MLKPVYRWESYLAKTETSTHHRHCLSLRGERLLFFAKDYESREGFFMKIRQHCSKNVFRPSNFLLFFLSRLNSPVSVFAFNMVILHWCRYATPLVLWCGWLSLHRRLFHLIYGSCVMSQEVLRLHSCQQPKMAVNQSSKKQHDKAQITLPRCSCLVLFFFLSFFLLQCKGRQILLCLPVIWGNEGLPTVGGTGGCAFSRTLTLRWRDTDTLCIIVCVCAQHGVLRS